jgi:hypothetical protein
MHGGEGMNLTSPELEKNIVELAKTLFDIDYETTICIEEMSELTKVLCKHKRKIKFSQYDKFNKDKLYEELSHVEISLIICKYLLDIDENILNEAILKRISMMKEYRDEVAPKKEG